MCAFHVTDNAQSGGARRFFYAQEYSERRAFNVFERAFFVSRSGKMRMCSEKVKTGKIGDFGTAWGQRQ